MKLVGTKYIDSENKCFNLTEFLTPCFINVNFTQKNSLLFCCTRSSTSSSAILKRLRCYSSKRNTQVLVSSRYDRAFQKWRTTQSTSTILSRRNTTLLRGHEGNFLNWKAKTINQKLGSNRGFYISFILKVQNNSNLQMCLTSINQYSLHSF